jgi:hypothetical protein
MKSFKYIYLFCFIINFYSYLCQQASLFDKSIAENILKEKVFTKETVLKSQDIDNFSFE